MKGGPRQENQLKAKGLIDTLGSSYGGTWCDVGEEEAG